MWSKHDYIKWFKNEISKLFGFRIGVKQRILYVVFQANNPVHITDL